MTINVPDYRKLRLSDVPGAPNWLGNVFSNLNLFGEQIQSLFATGTDISLIQGQKYTSTFTTPSNYATGGFQQIKFNYNGNGSPNCFQIGNIAKGDGTLILSPVTVTSASFNQNTSPPQILVNYVAGLAASTKYTLTVVAY